MNYDRDTVPACVYVLADNLDAALAAGEDLRAVTKHWPTGGASDPGVVGMRRWVLGRVKAHEMMLISRILQARTNAEELAQQQTKFKLLAHLFVSSLSELESIAQEEGQQTQPDFESGGDMVEFLRSRGVVAKDAPGELPYDELTITDEFLVSGRLPLGITLDLVAEVIEVLETQFDLYPDEPESEQPTSEIELQISQVKADASTGVRGRSGPQTSR